MRFDSRDDERETPLILTHYLTVVLCFAVSSGEQNVEWIQRNIHRPGYLIAKVSYCAVLCWLYDLNHQFSYFQCVQ